MSEFSCPVVRVGPIEKHGNADTLGITSVYAFPVIVRLGDFAPGDLAVYVPVDAVVPDVPEWAFLADHRRIKAKRLRGVFSMGLLVKAPAGLAEGEDAAPVMGIVKYEEPEPVTTSGEDAPAPRGIQVPYYDIESFRRWPDVLQPGEDVEITEKLHGCNARAVFHAGALHVGSHGRWKLPDGATVWGRAAREARLAEKLSPHPDMVFYGEVYGQVQDLRYGARPGELFLRFFDILDGRTGRWLDRDERLAILTLAGLDAVPDLHVGPWSPDLLTLAEGRSMLADNIREGIVIKPMRERCDDNIGRVILKLHGQAFLMRKGA